MNREIKFRAWNREKKIMCYGKEDGEQPFWDGVHCTDVEMVNTRLSTTLSDYEYMQYIGKKDANKKEIYEGDIVRDKSAQLIGVVKYSDKYLQFVIDDIHDGEQDYSPYIEDVEIIGNVYENAGLLEVIKNG